MTTTRPSSLLLAPSPVFVQWIGERFRFPAQPTLGAAARSRVIEIELAARPASAIAAGTVRLFPACTAPRELKKWAAGPEGYALKIDATGVDIWAAGAAGHLYGVVTLNQLRRQFGSIIPGLVIGDQPRLSRRGIQLCFPQGHTAYRHSYLKRLVPQLARWKLNELYLYLESYFAFPSLPHFAGPEAMTPEEARDLDRLCRDYQIRLIPMLNTLGHCGELLATQRYQHLSEYKSGEDPRQVRPFNLCASSPETEQLVDGMISDLCECFTADTIHVGGDEVSCLGQCPRCQAAGARAPFPVYLRYFERILSSLEKRGKRGGIWGDMLLHFAPDLLANESRKLFQDLRKQATIYDWSYSSGSPKTLAYFAKAGLETIACSSTHLCYSSALWPSQSVNQRDLYLDAIAVGAQGGMTTAWGNFCGLHEEQFNYLHATGATLLWSGAEAEKLAGAHDMESFDRAYSLQRYNLNSSALTDYFHSVGDAQGPVLRTLQPQHGLELRKCLYHTDNPLLFWDHFASLIAGEKLNAYAAAIRVTREHWNQAVKLAGKRPDPDFWIHEGPLLMHEHLLRRFVMTEKLYQLYDQAAQLQYEKPARFRERLEQAAATLLSHLEDFTPVDQYLARGCRSVGFDRSTLNRVAATRKQIRHLADYLLHLKKSYRPLPAFHQLHLMLLSQFETSWYGDREHEWAAEIPRFRRYSVTPRGVVPAVEAHAYKERFRRDPSRSPFVGDWRLSPVKAAADLTMAPLIKAKYRNWQAVRAETNGFVNLHAVVGNRDGLVYLARRFLLTQAGNWLLHLGHDGGAKVFVDGEVLSCVPDGINPAQPERSRCRLRLAAGVHEVVIAFDLNEGNGWGLFFHWEKLGKTGKPFFPQPME